MGIKVKLICKKCGDKIRAFIARVHRVLKFVFVQILSFDTKLRDVLKYLLRDTLDKLEIVHALKGQQAKYIGDSVNMLGMIPGATYEISRAKKHDGILIISLTGFGHAEFDSKYFEINSVLSEKHMKELFSENDVAFR